MNILQALASGPRTFHGEGVNEQQEIFVGDLAVQVLQGGRAGLLSYTATLTTGTVVHSESALLGIGPNGKLCLWPVMSEIPVVLPHTEVLTGPGSIGEVKATFGSGPRNDCSSFREEITLQIGSDGSLVYAHAWGLPGSTFEDRSSCRMVPGAA